MPSICFSSIVKSSSNPFLEPTSTKPKGLSFLLKETTGAFDRARAHKLRVRRAYLVILTDEGVHRSHDKHERWQAAVICTQVFHEGS